MDAFKDLKEFSPRPMDETDEQEQEEEEDENSEEESGDEEEDDECDDDEDGEEGDEEEDDDGELGEDEEWVTDEEAEEDSQDVTLLSSDDDGEGGENCPICLNKFRDQDIGTPESCDHCFCLECIQEWANNVNTCPVDRQVFHLILAKHAYGDTVYKKIPVEDKKMDDEDDEDPTYCEICGRCDREDRLLLCDGCDQGYHCECLNPPLREIPVEEWFCPDCAQTETEAETINDDSEIAELISENNAGLPSLRPQRRQIARTRASERVREQIIELRLQRADRVARRSRVILSSDEENNDAINESAQAEASTSAGVGKTPVKRKTTKKKKKVVKRKKTSTAAKGKKKTPKRKGKKRRKRKKTSKKLLSKRKQQIKKLVGKMVNREVARDAVPLTTVKSRIAKNLGLTKPPTGTTIPLQKERGDSMRGHPGMQPLSVMGEKHELIGFNDEFEEIPNTSAHKPPAKKSKYSTLALFSHKPVGKPVIKIDQTPSASSASGGFDLLGSIMNTQSLLAKDSKDVTIQRDGSLTSKMETEKTKPRRLSGPLKSPLNKPDLYDDLPPLEIADHKETRKSPDKGTQTTEKSLLSDDSMTQLKYLDREVDTNVSSQKDSIFNTSASIFENLEENKLKKSNDKMENKVKKSNENSDESANENVKLDKSESEIFKSEFENEIKSKKIEIKISRSTMEEIDKKNSETDLKDGMNRSNSSGGDKNKLSFKGSENSNSLKSLEKAKQEQKNKTKENLSQLDDISDDSNEFDDNLEELEEKLQKAHKKLKKLENKDKKLSKKDTKSDKKEKGSNMLKTSSSGTFLDHEVEKHSVSSKASPKVKKDKHAKENVDKSDKKVKKLKDSGEKQKIKKVKVIKENKNVSSAPKPSQNSEKQEDDVIIATPPSIEVIEIPDDDDETQYVQNLDKKIIKSYSGHNSEKSRARHNLDLKSVVKKEKAEKESSEKDHRKRREGDKEHESDRSKDRKKSKKYKSRSRSRDRIERHRSRSHERSRRSRSRDRHRRNRKSKSRSRERSRRSRERGYSRERERSRDRDRSREREYSRDTERSKKHKRRDRSRDRSSSRERRKIRSRDRSRDSRDKDLKNKWHEASPEVPLSKGTLESGRLDTGRLIDLFDDKWKKREDLKVKKKKKERDTSPKIVQSPLKRTLKEKDDTFDMLIKKAKTPMKERTPEIIETVQPIQKIIDVFPENNNDEIDMFAENSDMETEIPEPVQENVIVINTVENLTKLHPSRPNLVPLPVQDVKDTSASEQNTESSKGEIQSGNLIPVVKSDVNEQGTDSPEYDPAFPTDDMEESPSPLMDEKSPPGTPVEYTNIPNQPQSNPQIIIGEPPTSISMAQLMDENFQGHRMSPLNQLPPQLGGKGILGEGGPFLLQRGEAPLLQHEVPVGIRLLQGMRPGMSPQQAMLMNPLLMNRSPQFQPRFARFPPGHLPPFGLQVTTQDGVPLQSPFPPRMDHGGLPRHAGLINGNFEGIHTDTSQPPPPFLIPGSGNPRLQGDPRIHLPPHLLAQGPPSGQGGPPLQQRVSIQNLVSIGGPTIDGPHISIAGQSISTPPPHITLSNHPLSIPSSQIRIHSPEVVMGNPLANLQSPLNLPRFQVPITNQQIVMENAKIAAENEISTPPTPTNDDTPLMNMAIEKSRAQSPKVSTNLQLCANKTLISIAKIGMLSQFNSTNDSLSKSSKSPIDECPSPDENEGEDIFNNKDNSSTKTTQASDQLNQLTKLLNAQAQLAQLVTKTKTTDKQSQHSKKTKSKIEPFKVPFPPRGKTSNGKVVKEAESIDVIDMDVASPLDESSIEIPDSPDDFDKAVFGASSKKEKENKKRRDRHDKKEHKHKDKKVRDLTSSVKLNDGSKKPVMTVNDDNLKDVIRELESEDMLSSAVELTNKEKFLKKLHLQERVVDEVKLALKPFYSKKQINKEQYKEIMRRAVPKVCHSKSGDINPQKIATLVEAYVSKYNRKKNPGAS